jgi:hypothetical protein
MNSGDIQIAGWKTAGDWDAFRASLVVGGDAGRWQEAFDEYFRTRLDLRYLNPIKLLQCHGTFQGEGFSILAIQCTLIEFLESTVQGTNYHYLRKSETLGPHEYSSSSDLFVHFLCTREPFVHDFDESLAKDFYAGVRCALLHEARTRNDWTIWGKGPVGAVVDREKHIVYRDNFQTALEEFMTWYKVALRSDAALQEAFIRKFNSLCT